MSFYTSVVRYGNSLLYRGYNQAGHRIEKKVWFKPTLFTNTAHASDWKSLIGNQKVRPIKFESMKEAGEFIGTYKDVENREIHGMQNYIFQFINERFPGKIKFDPTQINVNTIDIEVASDDGFPQPDDAEKEIISIACYSTKDKTWRLWGLGDYDPSKSYMLKNNPQANIQYVKCKNEIDLLKSFLRKWSSNDYCPDVVTGWFIELFDIPYLVNRIRRVLGEEYVKQLSPWGLVKSKQFNFRGRSGQENNKRTSYNLQGIQVLDYIDLFKKFGQSYGANQESYKLDHIAYVVLKEKKLSYDEYGDLTTLYRENHQKFIDYNLKDIDLVVRIEEEAKLLELVYTMAYRGGVNYQDTLGTTAIWDSIIHRELYSRNIAVPPNRSKFAPSYPGAYVKEPKPGMYDWVVSFDLKSLYPNLIVQYNISPETIRSEPHHSDSVQHWLNKTTKVDSLNCVAANGSTYTKRFQGILPQIIVELYDERSIVKDKMIDYQKRYEKDKNKEYKIEADRFKNSQMSIKLLLNSLYGALGNQYFRYFNLEMAVGITLSGQLSILCSEKVMNKKMNLIMGTKNKDYVIAIDTDSLYVNFGPMIEKFSPKDPVKFLDKICQEKFIGWLNDEYEVLSMRQNCYVNRMEMSREAIADRGIWTAKKRYILNVHNNEGVQYAEPKLKIMGIEAIKTSTPEVCRKKFKKIFKIIMTKGEKETRVFIDEFRKEFNGLEPHQVAFPRSVSNVEKWMSKTTIYKKGTPIHSRAAIMYNQALKDAGLTKKYEAIQNGTKMRFSYLKQPNPIKENVIGFIDYLPKELKLDKHIDYKKQFEKSFTAPLEAIFDAIGWTFEDINTLEEFFV